MLSHLEKLFQYEEKQGKYSNSIIAVLHSSLSAISTCVSNGSHKLQEEEMYRVLRLLSSLIMKVLESREQVFIFIIFHLIIKEAEVAFLFISLETRIAGSKFAPIFEVVKKYVVSVAMESKKPWILLSKSLKFIPLEILCANINPIESVLQFSRFSSIFHDVTVTSPMNSQVSSEK